MAIRAECDSRNRQQPAKRRKEKTMFKLIIAPAIALTATAALFAVPQQAMAAQDGLRVEVSFTDLDLATSEGQQKLERRIARAASKVCAMDDTATGSRMASREANACYAQALRNVRASVAAAVNRSQVGG
jgi:UrcA family protein